MDISNNYTSFNNEDIFKKTKKNKPVEKIDKRKKRNSNNEECIELKTIEYRNMLMKAGPINGTKPEGQITNEDKINLILDAEKDSSNDNKPWNKLTNLSKINKLNEFAYYYITSNELSNKEELLLKKYLKDCFDRKKLSKVKDIQYDKETGKILGIPGLIYNKLNKNFTFKNIDKKNNSTKSLGPKKKIVITDNTDNTDNNNNKKQ